MGIVVVLIRRTCFALHRHDGVSCRTAEVFPHCQRVLVQGDHAREIVAKSPFVREAVNLVGKREKIACLV